MELAFEKLAHVLVPAPQPCDPISLHTQRNVGGENVERFALFLDEALKSRTLELDE